jgi:hypothetical protein
MAVRRVRLSGIRLALALLVGALVLALFAVFASAALDRPAKTLVNEVTVDASAATVWEILTDFDGYGDWNPVVTSISGERRLGAELELALRRPGADVEELHPEIVIWRPNRKFRWMSRRFLPGISDREYEVILEPLDDGRVRVLQEMHLEGVLAPFADEASEQAALDRIAAALTNRVAERSS